MELRCGSCGHRGVYQVGALVPRDPSALGGRTPDLERGVGFVGYFRCKQCDAGGPWQFTLSTHISVTAALQRYQQDPDDPRYVPGRVRLFDGFEPGCTAEAVDHLRELIEQEPESASLQDRLGNLFRAAGRDDLAEEAFRAALEIDRDHLPSLYSLGDVLVARGGHDKEAARLLYRCVRAARYSPLARPERRQFVAECLWTLAGLHESSRGRIPLLPPLPGRLGASARTGPAWVEEFDVDLGDPRALEAFADRLLD